MSDGWVWLRCCGCGSNVRLVTFGHGNWDLWSSVDDFITEHSTERCHGDRACDMEQSRNGYPFFEIVTEKDAPIEILAVNDFIRDRAKLQ